MYYIPQNGIAYFWRAKHKQQIVFYLYFYVPWIKIYLDNLTIFYPQMSIDQGKLLTQGTLG
jgi:hypothetical protein